MRGEIERHAVSQDPEHRTQHVPGDVPVRTDRVRQLVEPDVRRLQGLVENIDSVSSHLTSPVGFLSRTRGRAALFRNGPNDLRSISFGFED